jgi:catecholate siderophore receptor
VQKANAVLTDPTSGDITLQSGQKQRVRGFEASLSGEVVEHLNVSAAYTWLDPVVTQDMVCLTGPSKCWTNTITTGKPITFLPKHAASVWLDYNAGDLIQGLSLGGGLVYQSKLHNAFSVSSVNNGLNTPPTLTLTRAVEIPETVELDAVAAYDLGKNYRIQFNINNITDRLNYAQSFGNRGTPAPGRSFLVSLEAKL